MCLGMDMRVMFPVCKGQEICAKNVVKNCYLSLDKEKSYTTGFQALLCIRIPVEILKIQISEYYPLAF